MSVQVDIQRRGKVPRVLIRPLKKLARLILKNEGVQEAELSVLITDDTFIEELNKTYRGVASPTDVLSFPGSEEQRGMEFRHLGDVVISAETAARQRQDSLQSEVELLLAHGLLHLLGYDDVASHSRRRMLRRQRDLLSRFAGREWSVKSIGRRPA